MRLFFRIFLFACVFATEPAFAAMEDDDWNEVRSENFRILTNGDLAQARQLARDLEQFRASVIYVVGSKNIVSDIPFRILALKSQADLRRFMNKRAGRGVAYSGGFNSSLRGNFAVIDMSVKEFDIDAKRVSAADSIIKHEYVHYILRAKSRLRYPYWYEEGFAEYLSTLQYENGEVRVGFPVASWHFSLNVGGGRADLEKMLTATRENNLVGNRALYGSAWLLVHYLNDDQALAPKVQAYLSEYDKTGDSLGAFNRIFQLDLDRLTTDLRKRANAGKYGYRRLLLPVPIAEPAVTEAPVPKTEARLQVAGVLRVFRRDPDGLDDVAGIYQDVLKAEPTNSRALAGLAEIDMTKRQLAPAEARLASIPDNVDEVSVLIARGDALVMKAFAAARSPAELSAPLLEQARDSYIAALRKDNKCAEAYYSYGITYAGAENNAREGVLAIAEASRLVPSSAEMLLYHAMMLLQVGSYDEAAALSSTAGQLLDSKIGRDFAQAVGRLARERNADAARTAVFTFAAERLMNINKEFDEEED
ncbi:MAG: hypothetical protein AB7O49_21790 [Sphingomonadales bacterium]